MGLTDVETFRRIVLHDTGVSVCSRVHFGRRQPDERERYVRLAYSGIDTPRIEEGLGRLKAYLTGGQSRAPLPENAGRQGSADR